MADGDLEERMEAPHGWRALAADTGAAAAALGIAGVIGAFRDMVVFGLSFSQYAGSRGAMALAPLALGRPYGVFRDWLLSLSGTTEESARWQRWGADSFAGFIANAVCYAPLYAASLLAAGAETRQIALAVGASMLASAAAGRPYGWLIEKARSWCGAYS